MLRNDDWTAVLKRLRAAFNYINALERDGNWIHAEDH